MPSVRPCRRPGEHLDAVLLDLLARRAAVTLLAALQVGVDRVAVEHEPGGQAGEDRDERRAVRLAGGGEAERHARKPRVPVWRSPSRSSRAGSRRAPSTGSSRSGTRSSSGSTGVVHFAFGELIALGVFVTLLVAAGSGPVSQTSVGGGAVPRRAGGRAARDGGGERRRVLPRDRAVPRARVGDRLGRRVARRRLRDPHAARRLLRPAGLRLPRPAAVPAHRRRRLLARRRGDRAGSLGLRRGGRARARRARCGAPPADALRPRARGDRTGLRRRSARRAARGAARRGRLRARGRRGPGWRRSSPRRPPRSTSTRRRASASTGCSPPPSSGSTPRRALPAGIAFGLLQATVTSAHAGGAELGPLRDVLPLGVGLALFAWRFAR